MDQTSDMPTGSARSARSPSFLHLRGRAGLWTTVKREGCTAHARYVPVASLIACLVAVGAASLWQATSHAGQTGPQPRAVEAGTGAIRIVVALPLTGPRRAAGAAARQRLALVTSAIDAQGGLGQRPLEIEILDDACSRAGARDVATRIVSAPQLPSAVIGHPCASAAITAAAIYQQGGVLFIAAGVRHPELTEKRAGPLVFRAAGRDDRQGADAGRRLAALAGKSGAGLIVHDRTVMARRLAEAAREAAKRNDGTGPEELTIVAGETDYTKTVADIAARRPEAVLFFGFPAEAAILLRQLRQEGLQMPLIVNDAMATAEFVDHAGALLETHVEVMMPVSINRDTLEESELSDGVVASDTAAALAVLADAITATDSSDPAGLAERLARARWQLEELVFDYKGDAVAPSFAPFKRVGGVWVRADLAARRGRGPAGDLRRTEREGR